MSCHSVTLCAIFKGIEKTELTEEQRREDTNGSLTQVACQPILWPTKQTPIPSATPHTIAAVLSRLETQTSRELGNTPQEIILKGQMFLQLISRTVREERRLFSS